MASSTSRKPCTKCDQGFGITTCCGCQEWFCIKHFIEHRDELATQMKSVSQEHDLLQRDLSQENMTHPFLSRINDWEQKSIDKIKIAAEGARADLRKYLNHIKEQIKTSLYQVTNNIQSSRQADDYTEIQLNKWIQQLKELRMMLENPSTIEILDDNQTEQSIHLIQLQHNGTDNKTEIPNRLLVDDAVKDDSSIVLFSQQKMDELELLHGDTVFIKGNNSRQTVCIALVDDTCPMDRIRMNHVVQNNIRVRLGDFVLIQNCTDIRYGKRIRIAPIKDTVRAIKGSLYEHYLQPYFLNISRPMCKDDTFIARAGKDAVEFKVMDTDPSPYCMVTPKTIITVDRSVERE